MKKVKCDCEQVSGFEYMPFLPKYFQNPDYLKKEYQGFQKYSNYPVCCLNLVTY